MTQEGLAIQRVYTLPKWMYKGLGVNGGGDLVGRILVNGSYKNVYVSWRGINSKRLMPGYFPMEIGAKGFDDNGNVRSELTWFRLPYTGGWDTIKERNHG